MAITGGTDWTLIREVIDGTIDACEKLEKLMLDSGKGEYDTRPDRYPEETVGGFLGWFVMYPERTQREILRLRTRLNDDQPILSQLGRSLIYTAMACAEVIGLKDEKLRQEFRDLVPHCPSAGYSVESHLRAIPEIKNTWIVPCIEEALNKVRNVL
jgi:hypothetical protein